MLACAIRPLLDEAGAPTSRVALSITIIGLPAPLARAHVSELLAEGARPGYLHSLVEWRPERDLTRPYAAEVFVTLEGPRGTPFAGVTLRVHLYFPPTYPSEPPKVRYASHVYHSQILEGGLLDDGFYACLGWEHKPARHVRTVIALAHALLLGPLPGGTQPSQRAIERLGETQRLRTQKINAYRPLRLHAQLFAQPPALLPGWLKPELLAALDTRSEAAIRSVTQELAPGIFSLELFSPQLCALLLAELAHFEASGLPAARPNSMNRYGVLVDEIGLERLFDELRQRVLAPLAEALYPAARQHALDHHHAFSVRYAQAGDRRLDMHHDDSEVTLNVCLGRHFEGAGLTFCGLYGSKEYRRHSVTYAHQPGHAVLHLGRQRHGADSITHGERVSLVLWARSSSYRANEADEEGAAHLREPPDEVCLSYTHDIDFERFRPLSPGVEGKRERLARLRAQGGG